MISQDEMVRRIEAIRDAEGIDGPTLGTTPVEIVRIAAPLPIKPKRCQQCGIELRPEQRRLHRYYCSTGCYGLAKSDPVEIVVCPCGQRMEVPRWLRRRGRGTYCSIPCQRRYRRSAS